MLFSVKQIISAVGFAHNKHICHRDLKLENILLKTKTLEIVKVADFGLSAFYRPGALMKSSCGTLSFLAPEVFAGTSNAGPPLDVWAMGVILFALLCGRLPFEGPDLRGTKRPRDAVIQSRISKGQYKIEESLSPEAKDLVRRLLRVDPSVRASVPETFSHIWLRSNQGVVSFEPSPAKPAIVPPTTSIAPSSPLTTSATATSGGGDTTVIGAGVGAPETQTVNSAKRRSPPPPMSRGTTFPCSRPSMTEKDRTQLNSAGGGENSPGASLAGSSGSTYTNPNSRRATPPSTGVRHNPVIALLISDAENESLRSDISRSHSRSRSRSSCAGESEHDIEHDHDFDYISCVNNLEQMSGDEDNFMSADSVSAAERGKNTSNTLLPTPTFLDDMQPHPLTLNGLATLNMEGGEGMVDLADLRVPLPPPSPPSRPRSFVRENSFESRNSQSKDCEVIDEGKGRSEMSSPRTPPPTTSSPSPFMLVPLRRKEVTVEKIPSPRRPRTSTGGDYEEIARYVSSSDCFDYDMNDESLTLESLNQQGDAKNKSFMLNSSPKLVPHSAKYTRRRERDTSSSSGHGNEGGGGSYMDEANNRNSASPMRSSNGDNSKSAGGGAGKFNSPSASRTHNKLHIAGSSSLKTHTISSPISSGRTRYNGGSTGGLDGSPPVSTRERGGSMRTSRFAGSPDIHAKKGVGGTGTGAGAGAGVRASTSYGRKVVINRNTQQGGAGRGGHGVI